MPMSALPIVVLGNFDGVHRGHRALLQAARSLADDTRGEVVVWTFDTLPEAAITPLSSREKLLLAEGADRILYASFATVKAFSPRRFVKEILHDTLGAGACVCGYNYTFGLGGSGTPTELATLCHEYGIACHVIPQITLDGEEVSSSRIRTLLREGDIVRAEALLGHPFSFLDTVVGGNRIGRTLGFPTINFTPEASRCLPRRGVYASSCRLPDGRVYAAVTNIGSRPTVTANDNAVIETHLLDFDGDLYGLEVEVILHAFLRPETKFPSKEALQSAIAEDMRRARLTVFT